jgi:hypothetical protein
MKSKAAKDYTIKWPVNKVGYVLDIGGEATGLSEAGKPWAYREAKQNGRNMQHLQLRPR